ncbi:prepilin-type N-terminal cleavage/methylation domain-containing protein [Candidatus Kaiserbacteria bacterium]|nr:prepilin-type N-terminal cleavage/methylation domain-containing protein [Candidatus Kaiserbacteria bacterium]
MMKKVLGTRCQVLGKIKSPRFFYNLKPKTHNLSRGFTLLETLVAVTLLAVSIVAPMSLASRSLASAFYARDQVTAFHLAQEAIESVRAVRDGNVLRNALGTQTDILAGIPIGTPFTVDTRLPVSDPDYIDESACVLGTCPPLEVNASLGLYGYGHGVSGWAVTRFTRTASTTVVRSDGDVPQEILIAVTVTWKTGVFNTRSFTISENMYRWLNDGTTI